MAGYCGYSMSNNAVWAYENGEKPYSKWTKADILKELEDNEVDVDIERLRKISAATLKKIFLDCVSYHHTSKYYNATDFYAVNLEACEDMSRDEFEKMVENLESERKAATKVAKEEKKAERWECSFFEWSGTRNHPKATRVTYEGNIIGNWFFPDNYGGKKSINTKGFLKIRKIED